MYLPDKGHFKQVRDTVADAANRSILRNDKHIDWSSIEMSNLNTM